MKNKKSITIILLHFLFIILNSVTFIKAEEQNEYNEVYITNDSKDKNQIRIAFENTEDKFQPLSILEKGDKEKAVDTGNKKGVASSGTRFHIGFVGRSQSSKDVVYDKDIYIQDFIVHFKKSGNKVYVSVKDW